MGTSFLRVFSAEGSLRRKFGIALLAALVLICPPTLSAIDAAARWAVKRDLAIEREMAMRLHAAAVAKPLYDFDFANLERMASIIATADNIDRVQIEDASGVVVASYPRTGAAARENAAEVAIQFDDGDAVQQIGALHLWFNADRASAAIRDLYWRTGIVIFVALAFVFIVLMATLRRVMLRPLGVLMTAIERSNAGGGRIVAEWRSSDEMGRLVKHFNAMQLRLSDEERKLKDAYATLSTLYNQTPAMLFSVDDQGAIADVSDYWLIETGYRREQVVGRPFADFLASDDGAEDREFGEVGFARWHCRFRKASGLSIDVYVSETMRPLRLGDRERRLLVMVDISDLKKAEEELLRRARTDSLTGLPNRRHFKERLAEVLSDAGAEDDRVDVFFIDLDRFKWVNDNLGHQAGDEVLNRSANCMRSVLPENAFFARLGGDEFAVFHRGGSDETAARDLTLPERSAGRAAVDLRQRDFGHRQHRRRQLPQERPLRRRASARGGSGDVPNQTRGAPRLQQL